MHASFDPKKTLLVHLLEIRNRLFWVFLSVITFSFAGYFINNTILAVLIEPLKQPVYFVSPTGGFEVVLKISLLFGLVASAPVIAFQIYRFLEPIMPRTSKKILIIFLIFSWFLMMCGISFAYFISLPISLNFLGNFGGKNLESLISTDTYFSFVFRYLGGFALFFQLPLIFLIYNQMKRLEPRKLFSLFRYFIILSFIIAAIITPTADPLNQFIMAFPLIILYLFTVILIWIINRPKGKESRISSMR